MTAALLYAITGIIYARHARRGRETVAVSIITGALWFPIIVGTAILGRKL